MNARTSRERGAEGGRALRCALAGLALALGALGAPAAPARAGEIVAIVNGSNPVHRMTLQRLRLLYGLYQRTWEGGERVELLLPEAGSEAMAYLTRVVFRKELELEIDRYYLQAVFQQRIVHRPLQPTEDEAIARVRTDPSAIALVDRDQLRDAARLRVLRIEPE